MSGAPPEKPREGDPTKTVAIYRKDSEEADRLFGDSTSYARRFNAILDVVKRERLVEKVRRKVLGAVEVLDSAASRITPVAEGPEEPGSGTNGDRGV